jgi:hypothetical protein
MVVYIIAAAALFWLGTILANLGGLIFVAPRSCARWS